MLTAGFFSWHSNVVLLETYIEKHYIESPKGVIITRNGKKSFWERERLVQLEEVGKAFM